MTHPKIPAVYMTTTLNPLFSTPHRHTNQPQFAGRFRLFGSVRVCVLAKKFATTSSTIFDVGAKKTGRHAIFDPFREPTRYDDEIETKKHVSPLSVPTPAAYGVFKKIWTQDIYII